MSRLRVETTENRIRIEAPWREVFDRAAAVDRWPEFLPHYRSVRRLDAGPDGCVVRMAARHGFWPIFWTARLEPCPDERRIYFVHLAGPVRGMRVRWELSEESGTTEVAIRHDLCLTSPWGRLPLFRWIAAEAFIRPIACRTLLCMKRAIEGQAIER